MLCIRLWFILILLLMWWADLMEFFWVIFKSHIWLAWLVHCIMNSRDELCLNSLPIREVNTNDAHSEMMFLSNCSLSVREKKKKSVLTWICSRIGFEWHHSCTVLYQSRCTIREVAVNMMPSFVQSWLTAECRHSRHLFFSRQNISNSSIMAFFLCMPQF